MGVHGGKFGVVNGQSTVRDWSVNDIQTPAVARASNTKNAPVRKQGVHDWSGSFNAFGAIPVVMPGESFSFSGYTAPDNDVSGNGEVGAGTALVDSVVITWNWGSSEIVGYVVNFSGHLALTWSSSSHSDLSTPDTPPVCGTKVQVDPGGGYVDLPNLTQAVLTLSATNPTYVNSSTIVGGVCWTGRKAGPIDWTLALTQQDTQRVSGPFSIGDDLKFKIFSDATNFWDLWWGHIRDFTGLQVNRETGAVIQRTVNVDWNSYNGGYGRVRKPAAGVDWWP